MTVDVQSGTRILDTALDHHLPIYHTCGGNCSCSTCRILVLSGSENLSAIEKDEAEVLDTFDLKEPHRLGCQAHVLRGEVTVEIPKRDKEPRPNKIPSLPGSTE